MNNWIKDFLWCMFHRALAMLFIWGLIVCYHHKWYVGVSFFLVGSIDSTIDLILTNATLSGFILKYRRGF